MDIRTEARELLAGEMRREHFDKLADQIINRDEVQEHNYRWAIAAISAALAPLAEPYEGGDVKQATSNGVAVYGVCFGDEGRGLYVRLTDFNRKMDEFRGYMDAFYQVAEILGIDRPQVLSPKEVWDAQMLPALCARLLSPLPLPLPSDAFTRAAPPKDVWVEVCPKGLIRGVNEEGTAAKGYVPIRYVRADE